jgi:putative nucleotidyltransferase with HDIG domain
MERNLELPGKRAIRYISGRAKPWSLIIVLIAFAACFLITAASVTPTRYEVNEGDIAKQTITAPRDTVDKVTTAELQEKAKTAVKPIYKQDKQSTEEIIAKIQQYYADARTIRSFTEAKYVAEMMRTVNTTNGSIPSFDPEDVKWKDILTETVLTELRSKLSMAFTDEEISAIASMKEKALDTLEKDIVSMAQTELDIGIREENLSEQALGLTSEVLSNAAYSNSQRNIAIKSLAFMKPNMVYDENATETEKNLAGGNVLPAVYKKGQNIVQVGEVVTKAQIEVLRDLGLKQENTLNLSLYIGVFIYLLLCFMLFGLYTAVFNRDLMRNIKNIVLVSIIVIIATAISIPLNKLEPRIITALLGTMLACILVSPKTAVTVTVLLAFITGFTSASADGIISERMLLTILCAVPGGLTAIFFLRRAHHRTEYIYSGFAAGLVNFMVLAMVSLIEGTGFDNMLPDLMWAMINGIGSAILAIGALPVLESVFRVATATKLLEILNPNQPLLKRLSLETPGTYHHSMITANLAEAAAEELGLNTLLVKASAYYHDIGKLKKPYYFKENQQGRDNPHDLMEPQKSAHVLREHVTYGKYLAGRNKLPRDVMDLIEQHHGTTVMQYFYCKAKERSEANPEDYRYKGPKPQTKEAAVIMLADCAEAAVRASGLVQKEKIREIIDKLIKERTEDGQLEECDVTQKDLARTANAFIGVYQGMFHERIQYPGVEGDAESHN